MTNVVIISKNKEEGIRSRAQETEEVPKKVNGETVASKWLRAPLQR
jgi:hypothetical protein